MKRTLSFGLLALLLLGLLPACSAPGSPAAEPTPTTNAAPVVNPAQITSLELRVLESFPVQVQAAVKGNFPDACTAIDTATQRLEGNTIYVDLTTTRPADKVCAQVITPFEHIIPLDVAGLSAGTYTVNVNGVTETFTLDADNKLP